MPNWQNPRVLRAWLIVVLWAAVVWGLGGDAFSAGETSRILRPLIEWLYPDVSTADMYRLLYSIRKAAHITEYALLAVLILRALWLGSLRSLLTTPGLTLVLIAIMAAADEHRQTLSAERGGSGWDVLLDVSGGILAITLVSLAQHWLDRPLFGADDSAES
jgi:VanZ family protein